jgi:5'-nucleotidase
MPATNDNRPHIFLDLDGVLADFDRHAAEQGKLAADGEVDRDALDRHWWATMPAFEGAKAFYDAAKKNGVVKFLTGPMLSTDCFAGKADWVQTFVPEQGKFALKYLIICPSTDKPYLAKPNHILIDDRIKNIQDWVAAGGIGIHHKGDFKETLKALELAVAKLAITNKAPAPKKPSTPNTPGM